MKTKLILLFVALVAITACKDRDAEKKIAALEARLNAMEGKKAPAPLIADEPQIKAEEVKPEGPLPVAQFERTSHDFGSIPQGKKVSYTYKLTNTGEGPLVIQSANPTCGCTVSDYTKESIPVGGTGFVTAEFDAKTAGAQNKSVTVTTNAWPRTTTLTFKANVVAANGPVSK